MGDNTTWIHRCIHNTRNKEPTLLLFGSRLGTFVMTMTCEYIQRVAGASGASVLSTNDALASSPVSILKLRRIPCAGA